MILVTGSAGYIGSEICSNFKKLKIKHIGIDNLKYSYSTNIVNKKNFQKCCISDERKIKKLIKKFNIRTVIHAAAFAYVVDSEINKKKYYENNILKTRKFFEILKQNKINNIIFLSSSNVYTENNNTKIFSEKNKTVPKNYYGKTKLHIEKYLIKKKFNNLKILRLFNVIGMTKKFRPKNFGKFKFQRLIFKMFYNQKKNEPIQLNFVKRKSKIIYPTRDFIDIRDLNKLIVKIIKSFQTITKSGIYNVGSGKSISLEQVFRVFNKNVNFKTKIKFNEINKNEYINTICSINKIAKEYKWRPIINIETSINSYKNRLII